MELYQAMSTLRAVRRLRPDPIPADVLDRVLTAATWAPSGGNLQPWRIITVMDPHLKQGLEELYLPQWEAYLASRDQLLATLEPEKAKAAQRGIDAGNYLATHMHAAPVICVFCYSPAAITLTDAALNRPSIVGGGSIYPAVQNLLLAARSEGLGCVLTTLLCYEEPAVKRLLEIPDDWYTAAHVPLGYPVLGGHGPISRKGAGSLVYREKFGQS